MVILDEVKRRLGELAPEVTDLADALAIEDVYKRQVPVQLRQL